MPVRPTSTLRRLNLSRTMWAIADAEPGPERNTTKLGLGLPRDPLLK
jgi:hypothetical protein